LPVYKVRVIMKVSSFGLASFATVTIAILTFAAPAISADLAEPSVPVPDGESFWYASLHGGIKFGEDWHDEGNDLHADPGWRVGVALGYSLTRVLSLEGELSYMHQELDRDSANCCDDSDLSAVTGMINLVAGLPVGDFLRPYVGAGAGLAHVSFDLELDDGDTVFTAQGLAGADIMITDHFAIGARYRLVHLGNVELEDDTGNEHDIDPELIQSVEAVFTIGF
jgi:opacity protein-like surface antigen